MSKVEPAAAQFSIDDGVLVLRGRLGLAEAAGLIEALGSRLDSITRVDLSALDDIDSVGVASLRLLQRQARQQQRELELASLPQRYRAICEAHRIDARDPSRGVDASKEQSR